MSKMCSGYSALGCEGIEREKQHKIVEVNYKMHQGFCFLSPAGSSTLGEGHRSREVAEWQTAPTWGCHKILSLTLSQGTIQFSSAKKDNFSRKTNTSSFPTPLSLIYESLEEPILSRTSESCRSNTKALQRTELRIYIFLTGNLLLLNTAHVRLDRDSPKSQQCQTHPPESTGTLPTELYMGSEHSTSFYIW